MLLLLLLTTNLEFKLTLFLFSLPMSMHQQNRVVSIFYWMNPEIFFFLNNVHVLGLTSHERREERQAVPINPRPRLMVRHVFIPIVNRLIDFSNLSLLLLLLFRSGTEEERNVLTLWRQTHSTTSCSSSSSSWWHSMLVSFYFISCSVVCNSVEQSKRKRDRWRMVLITGPVTWTQQSQTDSQRGCEMEGPILTNPAPVCYWRIERERARAGERAGGRR